jgi:hypothetical protein
MPVSFLNSQPKAHLFELVPGRTYSIWSCKQSCAAYVVLMSPIFGNGPMTRTVAYGRYLLLNRDLRVF